MNQRLIATIAAVACGLLTTPAIAGRGTQVDVPSGGSACSLGSTSCLGVDVRGSGLFSTAYIYKEGIVSFDALLPVGATSSDLSSLGGVSYFAAGFSDSANYVVNAFKRIGTDDDFGYHGFEAYTFNFYNQGDPLYDSDPETGEIFYSSPFAPPLQVQLFALEPFLTHDQLFDGVGLAAGYGFGGAKPLPGALVGFQVGGVKQLVPNTGGLLIGAGIADTDVFTQTRFDPGHPPEPLLDDDGNFQFDDDGNLIFGPDVPPSWSTPTRFTPLYGTAPIGNGVPEPADWLMLLLGFGIVGSLMRRGRDPGCAIIA